MHSPAQVYCQSSTSSYVSLVILGLLENGTSTKVGHIHVHVSCLLIVVVRVSWNTSVYHSCGYLQVVERVAEESMRKAVEEVKVLPDYSSSGEVHVVLHATMRRSTQYYAVPLPST